VECIFIFKRKLIKAKGVVVATDRFGSVRWDVSNGVQTYFPYGEERITTPDNWEKFGTYTRDNTGQDYADQRYYGVGTGRFYTLDPYGDLTDEQDPSSPASWNRYSYGLGDPSNNYSPDGLLPSPAPSNIEAYISPRVNIFLPSVADLSPQISQANSNNPGGPQNSPADTATGAVTGNSDTLLQSGVGGIYVPMIPLGFASPTPAASGQNDASGGLMQDEVADDLASGIAPRASGAVGGMAQSAILDTFCGKSASKAVLKQMLMSGITGVISGSVGGPLGALAGGILGAGVGAIGGGLIAGGCVLGHYSAP
jgi:RHS repeat-associated protein